MNPLTNKGCPEHHDYYPTVLDDGQVLYLRWDYTDTPHIFNRLLFSTNPDGTEQSEAISRRDAR